VLGGRFFDVSADVFDIPGRRVWAELDWLRRATVLDPAPPGAGGNGNCLARSDKLLQPDKAFFGEGGSGWLCGGGQCLLLSVCSLATALFKGGQFRVALSDEKQSRWVTFGLKTLRKENKNV